MEGDVETSVENGVETPVEINVEIPVAIHVEMARQWSCDLVYTPEAAEEKGLSLPCIQKRLRRLSQGHFLRRFCCSVYTGTAHHERSGGGFVYGHMGLPQFAGLLSFLAGAGEMPGS